MSERLENHDEEFVLMEGCRCGGCLANEPFRDYKPKGKVYGLSLGKGEVRGLAVASNEQAEDSK